MNSADDLLPVIDSSDLITFSYSGLYTNTNTGELITAEKHSGTSRHYANYEKIDTCSGVAAASTELNLLTSRLISLDPDVEIDIVAHSMGGLVSLYFLQSASTEILEHVRSVTTLDSPLQGATFRAPFSACDYENSPAWIDLAVGSETVQIISTLGGTSSAVLVSSITSAIGSPLPGESSLSTFCGGIDPAYGHTCIWEDPRALAVISDAVNYSPPAVPRLRWLDENGGIATSVRRNDFVVLYAPLPRAEDGVVSASIYEVDPLSADDFIETIQLTVENGVAWVWWRTIWTADGFLGLGGDPEYKFVIDNVDSPELTVR